MYGVKGSAWPVQPDQVWRVGPHLLACADLVQGGAERLCAFGRELTGRSVALAYTDPPWNTAHLKMFRRKAGLEDPGSFEGFLVRFFQALRAVCPGPKLVEMGTTYDLEQLCAWASQAGLVGQLQAWPITYSSKRAVLLGFDCPDVRELANTDDRFTPGLAMQALTQPGAVVFDPCLGLGCTSSSAERLGRECWATELHPRRLSYAIEDLRKASGHSPQLVGNLEELCRK